MNYDKLSLAWLASLNLINIGFSLSCCCCSVFGSFSLTSFGEIKIIPFNAIQSKKRLTCLEFLASPKNTIIWPNAYTGNTISKPILLDTIIKIDSSNFDSICGLTKIKISSRK